MHIREHTERMQVILRAWEKLCTKQSDEVQQDMELKIQLTCERRPTHCLKFRWNPGLQHAVGVL